MYPAGLGYWILIWAGLLTIWIVIISVLIWRIKLFNKKLLPGKDNNIEERIEELLAEISNLKKLRQEGANYLKKVVLKRYNPYHDTGGDQSFSAAILDSLDNGLIITSLHSRSGTRVFAKPVKGGKEVNFKFSKEEVELVEQAKNIN